MNLDEGGMKSKYEKLNRFRLQRRWSYVKLAQDMKESGHDVHWSVIRATLRGETEPRDYNDIAIDEYLRAHEAEIRAALSEPDRAV